MPMTITPTTTPGQVKITVIRPGEYCSAFGEVTGEQNGEVTVRLRRAVVTLTYQWPDGLEVTVPQRGEVLAWPDLSLLSC